jgi:hypothetical protein
VSILHGFGGGRDVGERDVGKVIANGMTGCMSATTGLLEVRILDRL